MDFQFSCFISYRHGHPNSVGKTVNAIHDALAEELSYYMNIDPFLDVKRMNGGDILPQEVALALCHSVCMVLLYTPKYFDRSHLYCTREFRAMETIERKRLRLLPEDEQGHGLIIPVAIRGMALLPNTVKGRRLVYDFESDLLGGRRPRNIEGVRQIAQYIHGRYASFAQLGIDVCGDCASFRLPAPGRVSGFLDKLRVESPRLPLLGDD